MKIGSGAIFTLERENERGLEGGRERESKKAKDM